MKRRTLLQWIATVAAALPLDRVRLFAQPRSRGARAGSLRAQSKGGLTPQAVAMLHEIGPTVLPTALGPARVRALVDKFVAWTDGYREGVALAHGYGHPRLVRSGATPVPGYLAQLAALEDEARARGGRWSTMNEEARRAVLDAAFAKAGVRTLPPRPSGQHVVVDLMAFYFRSSEANDDCYNAIINREVCRPIAITVRKPEVKAHV
jgi:hypothetical protein